MEIHVVRPGDTLSSIAEEYGVPLSLLRSDNQLPDPGRLVTGQTIVVRRPVLTYTVQPGDTFFSIAASTGLSPREMLRLNPVLRGEYTVFAGQTLVLEDEADRDGSILVTGYAYPFVDKGLLQRELPYLSGLIPFTYGIQTDGSLVELEDTALIASARQMGVTPVMHLSTLTEEGRFDNQLATLVLNNMQVQSALVENILYNMELRGYEVLDVDFEFVLPEDAQPYADFISRLRETLSPFGWPVIVALAPKTSADQRGLLYEGHNYRLLGEAADAVLLMTYEWGYTYGPPLAVAPLPNVRRVVEYALTEIPAEKILLGIPNYGYDWTLPFVQGESRATSISNQYAVTLAADNGVDISFDSQAQAPFFRYRDDMGRDHEVWFEDARSIRAKLSLISRYGLLGAGYWNLMRPFPQNWLVLNSMFYIEDDMSSLSPL